MADILEVEITDVGNGNSFDAFSASMKQNCGLLAQSCLPSDVNQA
ncbi:hypothetical protein ACO0LM_16030 [Undibacterium sp. Di26W]